jgi:beta-lactam-binding protein with PASTA domain
MERKSIGKKLWDSLRGRGFVFHFLLMSIVAFVLLFLIRSSLALYTKHGSKVEMISFRTLTLDKAQELARKNRFKLIVNDSVYLVNEEGGIIVRQNPGEGAIVKRGRKVYLTVTKKVAEEITSGLFPDMYGKSFDNIKVLLERRFLLQTEIKEKKFDPGPENIVLEAYFNDQLLVDKQVQKKNVSIPKGSVIEFVVSQRTKGPISIPELTCLPYGAIDFVLNSNELRLGKVILDPSVGTDTASAFVIRQEPSTGEGAKINIGESIDVYLSSTRPTDCP